MMRDHFSSPIGEQSVGMISVESNHTFALSLTAPFSNLILPLVPKSVFCLNASKKTVPVELKDNNHHHHHYFIRIIS